MSTEVYEVESASEDADDEIDVNGSYHIPQQEPIFPTTTTTPQIINIDLNGGEEYLQDEYDSIAHTPGVFFDSADRLWFLCLIVCGVQYRVSGYETPYEAILWFKKFKKYDHKPFFIK